MGFGGEHFSRLGAPGGPSGEPLVGVKAILLIPRNCKYFPRFILLFSFVFQLYEKYGVTMSGVLKRKYEELGDDTTYCSSSSCSPISSSASSGWESDEESSHGEPKPSDALSPSFTREYLQQLFSPGPGTPLHACFVAWWWVVTMQNPPWNTPLQVEAAVTLGPCHYTNPSGFYNQPASSGWSSSALPPSSYHSFITFLLESRFPR